MPILKPAQLWLDEIRKKIHDSTRLNSKLENYDSLGLEELLV